VAVRIRARIGLGLRACCALLVSFATSACRSELYGGVFEGDPIVPTGGTASTPAPGSGAYGGGGSTSAGSTGSGGSVLEPPGSGGTGSTDDGPDGSGGQDDGPSPGGGGQGNVPGHSCADGSAYELYVLEHDGELRLLNRDTLESFAHETLSFEFAASMAQAADGALYVHRSISELYRVEGSTGQGSPTSFAHADWFEASVGWADSLPGSPSGTLLYAVLVSDVDGIELHSVDGETYATNLLTTLPTSRVAVVGNDQGRLFAFEGGHQLEQGRVYELDPVDYSIIDSVDLPAAGSNGFDVVYLDGALYTFASNNNDNSSACDVHRIASGTPLHEQVPEFLGALPYFVIGAGARSCP
jgi:hypothetical protein